ncbi:MAG: low molecular weight protein arginine phosphatase [Moorella sp. (in: Bacteria)]|nr:low molecular weight protein arginine phosphatase [Moorella sp. (in: firmicutes)]
MGVILFVCTGNTCRSSMAAAIAARLGEERDLAVTVTSAGLAAREGDPATPEAIQALAEMGIDLQGHRAQQVTAALVHNADLVLAMTASHKRRLQQLFPEDADKIFTLKEYVRRRGAAPAAAGEGRDEAAGGLEAAFDDDIPDPIGRPLAVYRDTARVLAGLVGQALDIFSREKK